MTALATRQPHAGDRFWHTTWRGQDGEATLCQVLAADQTTVLWAPAHDTTRQERSAIAADGDWLGFATELVAGWTRPLCVEVDEPRWQPVNEWDDRAGAELILPEGFPEHLQQEAPTCQGTDCTNPVGENDASYEDTYGVDHEGRRWFYVWLHADGRCLCEDCTCTADEGGAV